MSQRDIEEKFMNTFGSISSVSKDQTKLDTSPNNFMTQSSFNSPSHSMPYSFNNRYKSKTYMSEQKCTCPHKGSKTYQRRELKCTCGKDKKNHYNGYQTETNKSRLDKFNTQNKNNRTNNKNIISDFRKNKIQTNEFNRRNTYGSRSVTTKVCTCKNRYQIPNLKNINIQTNLNKTTFERKSNKSYQVLTSPNSSQKSSGYMQNVEFLQQQSPIKILIPIPPNEIEYTYRLEIPAISTKKDTKTTQIKREKSKEKKEEDTKVKKGENKVKKEETKVKKEENKVKKEENKVKKEETKVKNEIKEKINKKQEIIKEEPEIKNEEPDTIKEESENKNEESEKPEKNEVIINENNYNRVKSDNYSRKIRANIVKVNNDEEKEESVSSEYDILQKIAKFEELKYKNLVNESIELLVKNKISNNVNNNENLDSKENNVISQQEKENNENLEPDKNIQASAQFETPDTNNDKNDIIEDLVQSPEDSPYPQEFGNNDNPEKEGEINNENNENSPYPMETQDQNIQNEEQQGDKQSSVHDIEEGDEQNVENNEIPDGNEEMLEENNEMDVNNEIDNNEEMEINEENNQNNKGEINNIDNDNQAGENGDHLESYEVDENLEKNENDEDSLEHSDINKNNQEEDQSKEKEEIQEKPELNPIKEEEIQKGMETQENHEENEIEKIEEEDDEENIEKQLEEYYEEQKKPQKEKKQEKKEEEDEESSSQPDVRLKLVDPDNPEASRYVYPVNNQQ